MCAWSASTKLRNGRRAWIHEEIAGVRLRVSAESFFQARPDGADALVDAVRAAARPTAETSRVIDAYAGVGLFSATVAAMSSVVAVERSASSVADARVNLASVRARIVRTDVEKFRAVPADSSSPIPPAPGSASPLWRGWPRRTHRVSCWFSCDPAAFGRDVGLLRLAGYELDRVVMVDLFGHTSHIELVSTFVR